MSVSKHLYLNRLVFSSLAGTLQTKVISNQNNGHCCRVPGRYVSNEAKKKFRDVFVRDLASVCFLVASPSKVCAILETWRVERTAFPFRVTSLLTHSCRVVKNSGGKRFTKLWHQGTRIFAYLQCNKMVMISLYFFISIYILKYVYIHIYIYISSYIIYIYIYIIYYYAVHFQPPALPSLPALPKTKHPTSARPSSEGSKPHLERRGSCTCGSVATDGGSASRTDFSGSWSDDIPINLPPWRYRPFGRGV